MCCVSDATEYLLKKFRVDEGSYVLRSFNVCTNAFHQAQATCAHLRLLPPEVQKKVAVGFVEPLSHHVGHAYAYVINGSGNPSCWAGQYDSLKPLRRRGWKSWLRGYSEKEDFRGNWSKFLLTQFITYKGYTNNATPILNKAFSSLSFSLATPSFLVWCGRWWKSLLSLRG